MKPTKPEDATKSPHVYSPFAAAYVLQTKVPAAHPANKIPAPAASHLQQVVQCAQHRPLGARGTVRYYTIGGTRRATDGTRHWYENPHGTWTRIKATKVPNYNRFEVGTTGRGGARQRSFALREGSAASYSDVKRRVRQGGIVKVRSHHVTAPTKKKRAYVQNMLTATTAEGQCPTASATTYALFFGAPNITGGYNWCHLIGHGAGGSDDATNILAASTHCNSEQLEIEKIAYQYKRRGVSLSCQAQRHRNSQYLASSITYFVRVNGQLVYTRRMNGFRATKPTFGELTKVKNDLTEAITRALR